MLKVENRKPMKAPPNSFGREIINTQQQQNKPWYHNKAVFNSFLAVVVYT
jgi:hypothetical protein